MPYYNDLRPTSEDLTRDYARVFPEMTDGARRRTLRHLLNLKSGLGQVAPRKTEDNLLVASWNLKEFGHTTQRHDECYFYIAEILSRFDLIAVQEIKSTLKDLEIVMRLLGENWRYLVTDITEGDAGNKERSGYIFNTRRVELSGLAGEISIWDDVLELEPDTDQTGITQLKRSPLMTGFKSGWKKFAMVNLHLHPDGSQADALVRQREVGLLITALAEKARLGRLWTDKLILVGDMNLYANRAEDRATVDRLMAAGYRECEALIGQATNASGTQVYDRMFFHAGDYFRMALSPTGSASGGVFRPFEHVYRDDDWPEYADLMKADYTGDKDMDDPANQKDYYQNTWRRNRISDHFPVWVEMRIDDSPQFLLECQTKLAGVIA